MIDWKRKLWFFSTKFKLSCFGCFRGCPRIEIQTQNPEKEFSAAEWDGGGTASRDSAELEQKFKFPIESQEVLDEFEKTIRSDQDIFKTLVS